MTAAKHTPGPWAWDGNTLIPVNRDPATSSVHSILDAEGGYGFLGSDNRSTLLELDADRALIAAAPELLEALRLADAAMSGAHMDMRAVKRSVRAAIAKATGGDQ